MSNLRKIHICHLTLSSQELRNWRMGCRGVFWKSGRGRFATVSLWQPGATETTEMEDLQVGIKIFSLGKTLKLNTKKIYKILYR